ncbi:MAG: SLC13 family permease [Eubacteriaceae bacterium]|nr:SLC13 family permease [Eubacteriaceae bacterium]
MATSTIAIIITSLSIICFITRVIPVPVAALGAALAMGIFKVVSFPEAFSGFSSDMAMMVMGSEVVGAAIFQTGAAHRIGRWIIRVTEANEKEFMLYCAIVAAISAAFASNLATVVIMMPMVAAAASVSNGAIKKKNVFMCMGFASMIGGSLTLVGSFPNLIGQAFLIEFGMVPMGFWDITWFAIPRFLIFLLFYGTIGYRLQKRVFDFHEKPANGEPAIKSRKPVPAWKTWMPVALIVVMTVGFSIDVWTPGAVAMAAALFCIGTGCISLRTVFAEMDWSTLWILAGGLGIAAGLSQSGAGSILSNSILYLFGSEISFFKLISIFSLIGFILSNAITPATVMTILAPIALSICKELGYDGRGMVMSLVMSLNLSFISPYATAPITVTMQGGYRFSDYVKVGGLVAVLMFVVTLASFYIAYG